MNEIVQLTCCKHTDQQKQSAVLFSRLDHTQRKPLIQRNRISTTQNVDRHWIVWILSDSPVSPCLEIPDMAESFCTESLNQLI